jgi:hypothetical protein
MYGGGFERFFSRRLGFGMSVAGYRLTKQLTTGGNNYAQAVFGVFFQTRSAAR